MEEQKYGEKVVVKVWISSENNTKIITKLSELLLDYLNNIITNYSSL
jgi:hypothetical protein